MVGRRATLGIVFADIVRSTQLFERYGDVQAHHLVSVAMEVLTKVTHAHQGTLIKTIGDEVMVTFEDPMRAVEAVCQMPAAIRDDAALAPLGMSIKVGLHVGEVLLRDDDVFGDAVNIAARVTALAKADQILTTRETIATLPPTHPFLLRTLGPIKVRGKRSAIEMVEVLWQPDPVEHTVLGRPAFRPRVQQRLVLHYQDTRVEMTPAHPPMRLGRDARSDLIVRHELVSREHARVECVHNQFILVDCSTNGTYLDLGTTHEAVFLHRDRVPLMPEGMISLGQDFSAGDAQVIRFEIVS